MDLLTKHKLLKRLESASTYLGLPTSEPEMRTSIIKMILATDMIFHYELQENLANILEIITDDNTTEQDVIQMSTIHKSTRLTSTPEEDEDENDEEGEKKQDEGVDLSTCTHHDEPEVKDIFSSQGAKSAITFFRRKSYFEEDMIPLSLKPMPVLPASPEEDEEDDESSKRKSIHHSSGADLVSTTIKDADGSDRIVNTPPLYIHDPQQRLILCQIILHAADISNALRPWPICLGWSNLVCEEFFRQGEAEKEHGLKVSPNMDRNQVSQTTIGLQFGDFVVSPYFEIFAALFPKADELLKNLAENRKQWIKMEEELKIKNENTRQEDGNNQRLPSSMLPDRPIINPSGRRVSVAAGMVVIPDDLEERTIGSGKNKRKYWGVRSVSHSDISSVQRDREHVIRRRKSEEPTHLMTRRLKLTPMSPNNRPSSNKKQMSLPISPLTK